MKEKILALLRKNKEISGEEISRQLHISRAAVAKHIKSLRQMGYEIQASTKTGYYFKAAPDKLLSAEIALYLPPDNDCNWHICTLDQADSTNLVLRKMANLEAPEFTVVIADEQTAGRGRLQRGWYAPPHTGLWMSVLFRPTLAPMLAQTITLTTAVAIAQACQDLGIKAQIKWPNDVLVDGKKICGILCEMQADMDHVTWIIVGAGVNINQDAFPPELADIATSLSLAKGEPLTRNIVAANALYRLGQNYRILCREGFAPIRQKWKDKAVNLGKTVTVRDASGQRTGKALDIDEAGYLLFEETNGTICRITAGDILL